MNTVEIETGIIYLVTEMLELYSARHNESFDAALDTFIRSRTYAALYDFDTGLYLEGPSFLLEWYEKQG